MRANVGLSAGFRPRDSRSRNPPEEDRCARRDRKRYGKGNLDSVTSVKIYCDGVMEYPALTAAMLDAVSPSTPALPTRRSGGRERRGGPDPACVPGKTGLRRARHAPAGRSTSTRSATGPPGTPSTISEAAREENGDRDLRHTITHLEAIDGADIPRFAKSGCRSRACRCNGRGATPTPWTGTRGYIEDNLYERLFPAAELWGAGAIVAGGSDYPVDPLRPMVQIETAVDRTGEADPGRVRRAR